MAVQIQNQYKFSSAEGVQISPTSFGVLTPMTSASAGSSTEAIDVVGRSQISYQMDWGGGIDPSSAKWKMEVTIDGNNWVLAGAEFRSLNKLHVYSESVLPYAAVRFTISTASGDDDINVQISVS